MEMPREACRYIEFSEQRHCGPSILKWYGKIAVCKARPRRSPPRRCCTEGSQIVISLFFMLQKPLRMGRSKVRYLINLHDAENEQTFMTTHREVPMHKDVSCIVFSRILQFLFHPMQLLLKQIHSTGRVGEEAVVQTKLRINFRVEHYCRQKGETQEYKKM